MSISLKRGQNVISQQAGWVFAPKQLKSALFVHIRSSPCKTPPFGHFRIFRFSKFSSPDEGLEPATLRLKVWCSTDWANRACVISKPERRVRISIFECQNCWLATSEIWKWLPLGIAKTGYCPSLSWGHFIANDHEFYVDLLETTHFHLSTCPVSSVGRASDF